MDRERLQTLTDRWRARHDASLPLEPSAADPAREVRALQAFPFRSTTPADYVAEHGADMQGFTSDEVFYADPALDAWLAEVGRLLRERW